LQENSHCAAYESISYDFDSHQQDYVGHHL
jgi:hypothetical protein